MNNYYLRSFVHVQCGCDLFCVVFVAFVGINRSLRIMVYTKRVAEMNFKKADALYQAHKTKFKMQKPTQRTRHSNG